MRIKSTVKIIKGKHKNKIACVVEETPRHFILKLEDNERIWVLKSEATKYFMGDPPEKEVHQRIGEQKKKSIYQDFHELWILR